MKRLWHGLMHKLGWNLCVATNNGWLCCGCGKYTPFDPGEYGPGA